MSYWLCCNSCFLSPSSERKLAVTSCGHVICSVCFQKGKEGKCLICNAICQVSPLSDKSSSEVKAMFSDINVVATKHLKEVSKVLMFQAQHQKRLLNYYQQKDKQLEEVLVKMKEEMQQMTKKLNEQSAYITKLENSLQHQSAKVSSVPHMSHSSHTTHGHQSASMLRIPYSSTNRLSRRSSIPNVPEHMELGERSLFRNPNTVPRQSLISPQQHGGMGLGTIPNRSSNQSTLVNHPVPAATVSCFQESAMTPDISCGQSSRWKSPVFKLPSSFRAALCPPWSAFLLNTHH